MGILSVVARKVVPAAMALNLLVPAPGALGATPALIAPPISLARTAPPVVYTHDRIFDYHVVVQNPGQTEIQTASRITDTVPTGQARQGGSGALPWWYSGAGSDSYFRNWYESVSGPESDAGWTTVRLTLPVEDHTVLPYGPLCFNGVVGGVPQSFCETGPAAFPTTEVRAPAWSVAQAPAEGCAGSVFTYTVAISNTGGAATTQPFTLTALLDPRAAYVPGSASNGGTWAGDRVSWRITEGLLPDGQEAIARSFAVQTDQSLLDNLDVLTHTYALHSLEVTPDGAAEGTTTVHKVWADFAHDAPKCVDSPVTFNYEMPQPPLANVTLDWTFGGGPSGSGAAQPTVQATFPVAGIYTVTVNAAGTCGIGPAAIDQTDSFTGVISIEGVEAQIAAGPAPACVGQDVGFWAIGPVTGTIAGYLWDFGDGVTSTLPSPAHPYAGAGDYTAALTITTAGGCVDTAVLPISVQSAAAAFEVFDDPSCMNETMAFSSTTSIQGSGPVSYTWAFGDGVVEDDADGQAQHAYPAPGLYTAALTVTTVAGCTDTATRTVEIRGGVVTLAQSATELCAPDASVWFTPTAVLTPALPVNYTWDFGDGSGPLATAGPVSHTYALEGAYHVGITAETAAGCPSPARPMSSSIRA